MKKLILLFLCLLLVSCSSTLPDMGWLIEENRAAYERDAYGGEKKPEPGVVKEQEETPDYEEFIPKDWTGPTLVWSMADIAPSHGVSFPLEKLNAFLEERKAPYRISLLKIKTKDKENVGQTYLERLLTVLDEKKVDLINLGPTSMVVDDEFALVSLLEKGLLEELPDSVSPFSKEFYYGDKLFTAGDPRSGNRVGVFIPDTRDLQGEFKDLESSLSLIEEHGYKATLEVPAPYLLHKLPLGGLFMMEDERPVLFWESTSYVSLAQKVQTLWEKGLLSLDDVQADLFISVMFSGQIKHDLSSKMGSFFPFFLFPREANWYMGSESAIYSGSRQKEAALEFLTMLYNDKELAKIFSLSDRAEAMSEEEIYFLPTFSLFNEHLLASEEFIGELDKRNPEERGYLIEKELHEKLLSLEQKIQQDFYEDWQKLLYMQEGWEESAKKIRSFLDGEKIEELRQKMNEDYLKQRREKS